jgi:transposase-like protein
LAELYGAEVSSDLISRVTDAVLDEVRQWQNRPAFTSLQRAFVATADVELTSHHNDGQIAHWALVVNVENSGNTPTVRRPIRFIL